MLLARKNPIKDPMEFEIVTHSESSTLEVQVTGLINAEYFLGMIDVVNTEIKLTNCKNGLYHNVGADSSQLTSSDMRRIVKASKVLNESLEGGKVAAVITNKLSYGLVRMWYAFSSPDLKFEFQLFNKYESAIHWLSNK